MPYTAGAINPQTGVPFKDENEWKQFDTWSQGQSAGAKAAGNAAGVAGQTASFADQHNTTYDWSGGAGTSPGWGGGNVQYTNDDGTIYFGTAPNGVSSVDYQKGSGNDPNFGGHIDPKTGKITYYDQSKATPVTTESGAQAGYNTYGQTTKDYYYNQDYGLGPDALGIIPIGHDSTGTPTSFYAGTPGGGGQVFTDLQSAKDAVSSYKSWYDTQHPAGTTGTQIAPSEPSAAGATATSTAPGTLTTPGVGELFFDNTQDFYTDPTRTSQVESGLKWDQDQPTESEQHWAGLSGKYNDPNHTTAEQDIWGAQKGQYLDPNHKTDSQALWGNWASTFSDPSALDAMYARQEQEAQNTLDRKASSGGWGDSGAAARATGNLGVQFADAALKGKQSWAQTGMGLAGASDASANTWANTGLALASGSDSSENTWANTGANIAGQSDAAKIAAQNATASNNLAQVSAASTADAAGLARISGGQSAATSAENTAINRENGSITNALAIGNTEATIASTGLGQAEQIKLQTDLAGISAKLQQGSITATQAQNEANAILASLGVIGKAADTISGNVTKKKSDGTLYYA